jgi:hypothetical protein
LDKADAAGDPGYAAALRLFVSEEENHARLLALLLRAGRATKQAGHWSATAFARLRHVPGLRTELLLLMVAEVVALRCYRALRAGSGDPLTSEVAGRILAAEERHVPFHCARLRTAAYGCACRSRAAARPGAPCRRLAGRAPRRGTRRSRRSRAGPAQARGRARSFVADALRSSGPVIAAILGSAGFEKVL